MGILGRVAGLGRLQRELAEVQALLQLAQVEEAVGQVGGGGVADVDRPGFRVDGGDRAAGAARREVVVAGHREGEADVVPDAGEADGVRLPLGELERPQLVVDGARRCPSCPRRAGRRPRRHSVRARDRRRRWPGRAAPRRAEARRRSGRRRRGGGRSAMTASRRHGTFRLRQAVPGALRPAEPGHRRARAGRAARPRDRDSRGCRSAAGGPGFRELTSRWGLIRVNCTGGRFYACAPKENSARDPQLPPNRVSDVVRNRRGRPELRGDFLGAALDGVGQGATAPPLPSPPRTGLASAQRGRRSIVESRPTSPGSRRGAPRRRAAAAAPPPRRGRWHRGAAAPRCPARRRCSPRRSALRLRGPRA